MGEPQPWASEAALVVKNPAANAGNIRDAGPVPGPGRFRGEGNSNPLQCSCLENPVGRGAWRPRVHERAESDVTERLGMRARCVASVRATSCPMGILCPWNLPGNIFLSELPQFNCL